MKAIEDHTRNQNVETSFSAVRLLLRLHFPMLITISSHHHHLNPTTPPTRQSIFSWSLHKFSCGKGCACEKECCSKYHDCEGIKVSNTNPTGCSGGHECASHDASHVHGPDCGHPQVIHDGHVDYVVDGHLHHPCGDGHCCSHGPVTEI